MLEKICCFVLTNFTRWVETIKLGNVSIMDYLMPPAQVVDFPGHLRMRGKANDMLPEADGMVENQ